MKPNYHHEGLSDDNKVSSTKSEIERHTYPSVMTSVWFQRNHSHEEDKGRNELSRFLNLQNLTSLTKRSPDESNMTELMWKGLRTMELKQPQMCGSQR
ncbi:hypothetical protein YC2023_061413 [Brassica napus]